LQQDYLAAHKAGDFSDRSLWLREFHTDRFLMFLEGRFDPTMDKDQRLT
jgi:hypothetical protein